MLEVDQWSVWYGAAQALFSVSLSVSSGQLVVLQGLNGAGKSTLLTSIMGLTAYSTGTVCYKNIRIEHWPSHRRAQAGLGFVAEDRRLFDSLSVHQNLMIAARGNVARSLSRVYALFPVLHDMAARPAGEMSGGEQQMLALGRTLMTEPRLLLLDEPCEGIAPVLVESIRDALLTLRADGMAMLVAEHNALLADHANRVVRLQAGQVIEPTIA
jgi:branched-chain amino acid transport system ATP-binding protein